MKSELDVKKVVQLKRSILKRRYEKLYKEWDGNFNDDRQLFCNVYRMLTEALNTMEGVTNTLVWVGFNGVFREEEQELAGIKEHFTGQEGEEKC